MPHRGNWSVHRRASNGHAPSLAPPPSPIHRMGPVRCTLYMLCAGVWVYACMHVRRVRMCLWCMQAFQHYYTTLRIHAPRCCGPCPLALLCCCWLLRFCCCQPAAGQCRRAIGRFLAYKFLLDRLGPATEPRFLGTRRAKPLYVFLTLGLLNGAALL